MNQLILVRHGQSIWNLEKRFTGWVDVDLTAQGKLEACKSGELIKRLKIPLDHFFCSYQKRAINSLELILNTMNIKPNKINKAWQLNERMYGELTGLNKDEMKKIHGEKKIHQFRRSWDISPLPLSEQSPYHPKNIEAYKGIPRNKIPSTESLKDTFDRVIPFYLKNIYPLIKNKQNVLIVAHGNSLRALCKNIFGMSEKNIINFEIPTGNPLLIKFDNKLKADKFFYLDKERSKNLMIKN